MKRPRFHDSRSAVRDTNLRFSLVGPGRVGVSLASWLLSSGACMISVAGGGSTGRAFARHQEATWSTTDTLETSGQDLMLIAVPDPVIGEVTESLQPRPQAKVILHTAGGIDAEILEPLRTERTAIGSLHPLKAFPHSFESAEAAEGVFFAVDGDRPAVDLARSLVDSWHGRCFELKGDSRALYHLAARLAAGGVVTLLAAAEEIAEQLELPPEAVAGYLSLAHGALDQIAALGSAPRAITGPVPRGERSSLDRQRQILRDTLPALLPTVDAVDAETRRQLGRLSRG